MSRSGWGIKLAAFIAAIFTGLAVTSAKAEEAPTAPEKPAQTNEKPGPLPSNGYAAVEAYTRKLARIMGLNKTDTTSLVNIFLVQSYSESKGNRKAANRTASESKASRNLYEARNNWKKLRSAVGSFAAELWWFPGSSGWFGLMPTVLLNVVRGRKAKGIGLGPESTTDAWASVVMYAAYLAALVRRSEWGRSSQDAYALKAGGAAGSLMDDPHKDRYKTAARHLDSAVKKLGLPANFGSRNIAASRIFRGRDWLALYREGLK